MITLETVKSRLDDEAIAYTIRLNVQGEHWASNVIMINGGRNEAPLRVVFGDAEGEIRFIDLRFGRYDFELFDYSDETVLDELMQDIHAVMAGKINVISAWYTRTHRWCGDSCFYVSPGEEDDDSEEYVAAVRRISKPPNRFVRWLTRRVTYAVYNWHSYREITR